MTSLVSDGDLRRKLISFGVDVGPITDSTRGIYQRMLKKKLQENKRPGLGSPVGVNRRTPGVSDGSKRIPMKPIKRPRPGEGVPGVSPTVRESGRRPVLVNKPAPKKFRLDNDDMEIKPNASSEFKRNQPKADRLYPSLPDDITEQPSLMRTPEPIRKPPPNSSPFVPPNPGLPVVIHKRNSYNLSPDSEMSPSPSLSPVSSQASPSSPTPNNDSGGFVNFMTGLIGAGVKKIVRGIQDAASPRQPLRSSSTKKHSSFREKRRSESSISSDQSSSNLRREHDSIPIDEVDFNKLIGEASSSLSLQGSRNSSHERLSSSSLSSNDDYDWELLPRDVEICKKSNGTLWILGKGGFGEVFKGLKDGVDEVAIKVIRVNSHVVVDQFKQEIDLISKLRHRHILQFYGACIQPTCLYMVTELMQTDLFTALRSDVRYQWSGIYGKEVLIGIASGLHYLHLRRPPVVHRDIKSPNILLMDGIAKIADVGIARTKAASDMTAQRGFTIAWAAPEVVYRKRATEKIDIWSFGVIIWEVATGKLPHPGRLDLPAQSPHALVNFYCRCVSEDASKRPSAADAVKELRAINR